MKKNYLLYATIFFLSINSIVAQNIYNLDNSLKYADYLFTAKEFKLAANEYERVLFLDSTNTSAKLKLVKSYRQSGNIDKAEISFLKNFPNKLFLDKTTSVEYAKILIANKKFDQCVSYTSKSEMPLNDKLFINTISYSYQLDWKNSHKYVKQIPEINERHIIDLKNILEEQKQLDYKKINTAMLFSALVPGAGKIYTGNWKDGLFSLVVVGVSGIQAYRGFSKGGIKSAYGWIYLSLSTGFYIGNIYGTGKAANKRNSELNHLILHKIEKVFNNYN